MMQTSETLLMASRRVYRHSISSSSRTRTTTTKSASGYSSTASKKPNNNSSLVVKRSFARFRTKDEPSWSSFSYWFAWYSQKLDTHPITTKCVTAGIISSIGNILAQRIAHHRDVANNESVDTNNSTDIHSATTPNPNKNITIDWAQVGRFAFLNVIFVAPVLHHWYHFIDRAVPGVSPSRVLQRVFWDEFFFSPMYISVLLSSLWKLEGSSTEQIKHMMCNDVPGIIMAEWALFIPTMALTFRFAPVKFQVLVINCVGVGWNTILSFMAKNAHSHHHPVKDCEPSETSITQEEKDPKVLVLAMETMVGTETLHHNYHHQQQQQQQQKHQLAKFQVLPKSFAVGSSVIATSAITTSTKDI